jgi:hypothetical protein
LISRLAPGRISRPGRRRWSGGKERQGGGGGGPPTDTVGEETEVAATGVGSGGRGEGGGGAVWSCCDGGWDVRCCCNAQLFLGEFSTLSFTHKAGLQMGSGYIPRVSLREDMTNVAVMFVA